MGARRRKHQCDIDVPAFIKTAQPKTGVSPQAESIGKLLDAGWCGQPKIDGHRLQLHLGAGGQVIIYNRHGDPYQHSIPESLRAAMGSSFAPLNGWTIVEGEYQRSTQCFHAFDLLEREGCSLRSKSYDERFQQLSCYSFTKSIRCIAIFTDLESCLKCLGEVDPTIEGLIFRSSATTGWRDSSILRCLKVTVSQGRLRGSP